MYTKPLLRFGLGIHAPVGCHYKMRIFNQNSFFEEAKGFIRDWVKLLSEDKFEEACESLDKPEDNGRNIVWKPEALKEIFLDYCWHKRMPVINNPYQMNLEKEVIDFFALDDGRGWAIDYEIPLDGEWGDLTAQFLFIMKSKNLYSTYLQDIHVL